MSPAGDRLGVRCRSTLDWFVPDLHGDVAGSWDASEATLVEAIRYDPWGRTLATGSGGGSAVGTGLWRYGGRLDVSPSALGTPLYDMSARFYSPGTGAFTSLDSVLGSAGDPLSMNRYLYAEGNPATLVDPSGHMAMCATADLCDESLAVRYRTTAGGRDAARRIRSRDHGGTRDSGRGDAWIRQSTRDRQYDAAEAHRQALSTPAIPTNRTTAADIRRNGRQNLNAGSDVFGDIFSGLGGVAYDNTVGLVSGGVDFATHLDKIWPNLQLAGVALTHLDMTARVAADDLGRGIDRFGKMSLDQQVRFAGDVVAAGVGAKLAGAGVTRAVGASADAFPIIPEGSSGGLGAGGAITKALRAEYFPSDEPAPFCAYCRTNTASQLDHVVPRKTGGDLTPQNLVEACRWCNPSKGARVAPKSPPPGYSGEWPPPWWPARMTTWWQRTYGRNRP